MWKPGRYNKGKKIILPQLVENEFETSSVNESVDPSPAHYV